MSNRSLVTAVVIVLAADVVVGVFVGLPTLLTIEGVNVDAGVIVSALAAVGAFGAAVAAVWALASKRRVLRSWVTDRYRRLRQWLRGLSLLPAVCFAVALGVAAAVLAIWILRWLIHTSSKAADPVDIMKLSFTVAGGVGAAVALVVAYRRQRDIEQGRFVERFGAAAAQLGDPDVAVRIAGVYAMAGVADESNDPARRQQCIDVLCGYLRLPYAAEQGSSHRTELVTTITRQALPPITSVEEQVHQRLRQNDREVRQTILRIITAHLQKDAQTSWSPNNFDFTGVLFEDASFDGATFGGERTSFARATFSGERASFAHTTFSGEKISFERATFSEHTSFWWATFSGGHTSFKEATFSGGGFWWTTFSGWYTSFEQATFSGGHTSFVQATFSGGHTSFEKATFSSGTGFSATFSGERTSFEEATFSGTTLFQRTTFSGEKTSFERATFSGTTLFDGTTFSGEKTSFEKATFSGTTRFERATFSGRHTSFEKATFGGKYTSFLEATFSGEKTSFDRPRAWDNLAFDWDRTKSPLGRGEGIPASVMPQCIRPREWPPEVVPPERWPTEIAVEKVYEALRERGWPVDDA